MTFARFLFLIGLVAPLGLTACHDRSAEKSAAQAGRPVQVATAKAVPWPDAVTIPATVSAVDTAVLASRAGGWVTQVAVAAGAHIVQGALLAEVGAPDAQGQLLAAQARVTAAKAALDEAAANERRYRALYRTHAASARDYEAAVRVLAGAKAELAAANAALTAATSNLAYAEIRAPFAGTIAEKKVAAGDFVTAGAPLFVIAGTTPEIRAYVGSRVYGRLALGDAAEVVVDGDRRPAIVTRLVAAADPATRTHLVELRLQEGVLVPFGAYAELHLTIGHSPQLTVPATALIRRAGLRGVFVVDANHHARFRLVRIGEERAGQVVVAAGLAAGERVVVAPPENLANGVTVRESLSVAPLGREAPRG